MELNGKVLDCRALDWGSIHGQINHIIRYALKNGTTYLYKYDYKVHHNTAKIYFQIDACTLYNWSSRRLHIQCSSPNEIG